MIYLFIIFFQVLGKPYLQHRFVHLKYLELVDMHAKDIYSAIGLVNAAPFLETFVMEVCVYGSTSHFSF